MWRDVLRNLRIVIYFLLIATVLVLSCKVSCGPLADSVHSNFHNPYFVLSSNCERAIYDNKPDRVLKLSNKYEKLELRDFVKRKEDPSLRVWEGYRGYPYYRALAHEASGDYENALKYLRFYWELPDLGDSDSDDRPFAYDYSDSFYWLVEGRIRYKMGDQENAFFAYCLGLTRTEFPIESSAYWGRFWRQITLDSEQYGKNPLSCFDGYSDFLKFVDGEYQKLECPEKYRETVEIFHALKNGKTFHQYLDDKKREHKSEET